MTRQLLAYTTFTPGRLLLDTLLKQDQRAEFLVPLEHKEQPITAESAPFAPIADLLTRTAKAVVQDFDIGVIFSPRDPEEGDGEVETGVLFPVQQVDDGIFLFPDLGLQVTLDPDERGRDLPDKLESALDTFLEQVEDLKTVKYPEWLQGRLGIAPNTALVDRLLEAWASISPEGVDDPHR